MRFTFLVWVMLLSVSLISHAFAQEYRVGGYIEIVGSSDCNRQLISLPQPIYPSLVGYGAHTYNGVVSIQALVNRDGSVDSVKGIAGHNFFRTALEKDVRKARFEPVLLRGEPVKFSCVISYRVTSSSAQTISCGICNRKALELPKPNYPPSASSVNVSGSVTVQVLIDEHGNIEKAKVISGHLLLRAAAVAAALQAKFEPYIFNGKPVKVGGTLVYNFKRDTD